MMRVLLVILAGVATSLAQQSRFVARPYDVTEGDAVVFSYLESVSPVKLSDIKSWKWDFDGDSTWEIQKTVGVAGVTADQITTTWSSATFSTAKGTGTNDYRNYSPKLQITKQDNSVINVTGITEDVIGFDGVPDPTIIVRKKGIADDNISVSFSANPRLARAMVGTPTDHNKTREIRFYAEVSFGTGVVGAVTNIQWDLDGNGTFTDAGGDSAVAGVNPNPNPGLVFNYPAPPANNRNRYDTSIKVFYTINGTEPTTSPIVLTKKDFIVIEDVPKSLSMGRAYRQGFPERYGWDDIVQSYQAADGTGNNNVYFNHFENAYFDRQSDLAGSLSGTPLANARQGMAETVNEMLQGQSMRGFQGMIDALRMRYPRITAVENGRLPAPVGAREETAALEAAALDFQQALQYAAYASRAYGADILRAGPDASKAPPYPQFPNYLTYYDTSLTGADVPIPAKNEYWQYAGTAGGLAQARTEKAKLLWRLSTQDGTALPEAKEECKVAATQSYLNMALLASGQTSSQFAQNEGNGLQANMRVSTDLFDKINAGVNPLGTDGSYIPNETFAAIHSAAVDAVNQAKSAEVEARNEKRNYDRNQADLRNELLNQRNQYITPLKLLTGIDPATYNNLATVGDQTDFRNAFTSRLNNLLANYPNADATGLGQYGSQVAAIFDAGLQIQQAINQLNNLHRAIEISAKANVEIDLVNSSATARLKANDISRGYSNSVSYNIGWTPSMSFSPGSIASGNLNAEDRDIQTLQQAQIADIELEAETRRSLLEEANLIIGIRRAGVALDQAKLGLDSLKAEMERYIEDLAHTRNTAADLYFQDPSFRVFASQTERRAAQELEYAVDKLYRLAKTLQYEWTEPYQNPIIVPASCNEPPALESSLFDKFTKLDSLFAIRSADEAQDYLDALKNWDSKLRRVNGTSVRGPNHSAHISAVPISVREHILGYKPNASTGYTLEKSIADFRNYLETNRKENEFNSANATLELHFPTGIEDNSYFPATGSRWNMRIHSIAADLYAESGFSDQQVAEIDLIQSGMVTLRQFWANPPSSDMLLKMTHSVDNYDRTVFATAFPARINGATAGRPLTEFDNTGLMDRPVGTTDWVLRINTANPANRNINFAKLKDIVLRFTYTYGNAPIFDGF